MQLPGAPAQPFDVSLGLGEQVLPEHVRAVGGYGVEAGPQRGLPVYLATATASDSCGGTARRPLAASITALEIEMGLRLNNTQQAMGEDGKSFWNDLMDRLCVVEVECDESSGAGGGRVSELVWEIAGDDGPLSRLPSAVPSASASRASSQPASRAHTPKAATGTHRSLGVLLGDEAVKREQEERGELLHSQSESEHMRAVMVLELQQALNTMSFRHQQLHQGLALQLGSQSSVHALQTQLSAAHTELAELRQSQQQQHSPMKVVAARDRALSAGAPAMHEDDSEQRWEEERRQLEQQSEEERRQLQEAHKDEVRGLQARVAMLDSELGAGVRRARLAEEELKTLSALHDRCAQRLLDANADSTSNGLREALAQLSKDKATLELKAAAADSRKEAAGRALVDAKQDAENIRGHLRDADERCRQQATRVKELEASIEGQRRAITTLKGELADSTAEQERLVRQVERAREAVGTAEAGADQARAEAAAARREAENVQDRADALAIEKRALVAAREELDQQTAARSEQLNKHIADLKHDHDKFSRLLQESHGSQVAELQAALAASEERRTEAARAARERCAELERGNSDLKTELAELNRRLAEAEAEANKPSADALTNEHLMVARAECERLRVAQDALREGVEQASRKLAVSQRKERDLQAELEAAQEGASKATTALRAELDQVSEELVTAQQASKQASRELRAEVEAAARAKLREDSLRAELQQMAQAADAARDAARARSQPDQVELAELRTQLGAATREGEASRRELERERSRVAALEESTAELEKEAVESRADKQSLTADKQALKEQLGKVSVLSLSNSHISAVHCQPHL